MSNSRASASTPRRSDNSSASAISRSTDTRVREPVRTEALAKSQRRRPDQVDGPEDVGNFQRFAQAISGSGVAEPGQLPGAGVGADQDHGDGSGGGIGAQGPEDVV